MSASLLLFAAVLLAVGLMRLVELRVSLARIAQRKEALVEEPLLFPAMASLHAGLVLLPLLEVYFLDRPVVPALLSASLAALLIATMLRIWTLSTIGAVWNVRVLPPPPDRVVTTGPYRYLRHPNYLCVIIEIAALPLLHTAVLSAIFLTILDAVVLFSRIRTEERALMQIPAWREAFSGRARFIPGVF